MADVHRRNILLNVSITYGCNVFFNIRIKKINSDNYFDTFNHRFDLLVITLIITYLLSYLSYIYIENKLSTYIKEKVLTMYIRKK